MSVKKSIVREKNAIFVLKNITCDPSLYIMDLTASNFMGKSIVEKMVKPNFQDSLLSKVSRSIKVSIWIFSLGRKISV